jgi:phosphatidylglycerol:prolipoprotein diacylglycerol transferase
MRPVLISFDAPILGKVALPSYLVLLAVGFGFATLLTWRDAKRQGINRDKIIDVNLYMIIFGVLGARVLHVIADGQLMHYVTMCLSPETVQVMVDNALATCSADAHCGPIFQCNEVAGHCHPPRNCLMALKVWEGGLSYYGGFIFAASFGLYYVRKHKLPIGRCFDMAGYCLPLGLFWGRMGCFLNSCCFGKTTGSLLGVVFPPGSPAWKHQEKLGLLTAAGTATPVHPTQLYSALLNLLIFAVLYFGIRRHKRFDGQVFWWFVVLYGLSRATLEFFRDDERGMLLGLISTSQLISIPLIIVAIVVLIKLGRRASQAAADTSPQADPPQPQPES